ncbi:ABC transporter ATP-binding protein [Maribacter chungangensis]|uniref:ABC transporter ATP-binding protein n=1 Tax=Maribacter chungangensis TaxID=1069117 RepID=A0ABW3B2V3_9FLAO
MTSTINMNPLLEIASLRKSFNGGKDFVVDVERLSLNKGKILALVGESGSGKTTLVRLIAGLETSDSGSISIGGQTVTSKDIFVPPEQRKIGMVFQDYALFPHLTVYENITYGCKHIKKEQLTELLQLVGLVGYEKRYPHQLSGGQQQRVALARALAPRPQLLILDEPFSNLDIALKLQLRNEIFDIIQQLGITAIFVTHDTQDAIMIADDIAVLRKGAIIQQGNASTLYRSPNRLYVAALFGPVVPLTIEELSFFGYPYKKGENCAIRMEQFQVNKNSPYSVRVHVERSLFFGQQYLNTCKLPNGKLVSFTSVQGLHDEIELGFGQGSVLTFPDNIT